MTAAVNPVVIVSALRTPIGSFQVALKTNTAPSLEAIAIKEVCGSGMKPVMLDTNVIRASSAMGTFAEETAIALEAF